MIRRNDGDLDVKEAFGLFERYKESTGVSQETINNYRFSFNMFLRHTNYTGTINGVTKNIVVGWFSQLKQTMKSMSSVNHYATDIRVFLYWCMDEGYMDRYSIQVPKAKEEKIKMFSDDDLEKLLVKPRYNAGFVEWRTWTIICFILATGARVKTVSNIKMEDVNFARKEITYTHLKNGQVAIVPISPTLEKVLQEYLKNWKRTDNTWLFCDVGEKQLSVSAIQQALEEYCVKRGVQRKGPHALRHNFARQFIINGGNPFILQKMLTHSDLTMTKHYVRLFSNDLHKDFERFSPLDTLRKDNGRTKTITRN